MVEKALCETVDPTRHHVLLLQGALLLFSVPAAVPRRLIEETVMEDAAAVPLVTYEFRDFKVGPQVMCGVRRVLKPTRKKGGLPVNSCSPVKPPRQCACVFADRIAAPCLVGRTAIQ